MLEFLPAVRIRVKVEFKQADEMVTNGIFIANAKKHAGENRLNESRKEIRRLDRTTRFSLAGFLLCREKG